MRSGLSSFAWAALGPGTCFDEEYTFFRCCHSAFDFDTLNVLLDEGTELPYGVEALPITPTTRLHGNVNCWQDGNEVYEVYETCCGLSHKHVEAQVIT